MKTCLVLAAAFLSTAVSAEKCVYATVAPELHSLAQPIAKCMTATDNSYNLVRPEVPPTPEQSAAICSKCKDFVAAVTALPPWPDCTLNLGGIDQTLTAYFDKMIGGCKAGGSDPVVATTTPPATTSPAPAPTTVAPSPTTTTPLSPTTPTTAPSGVVPTSAPTATPETETSSGSQGTTVDVAGSTSSVSEPVVTSNSSAAATTVPTTSSPSNAAAATPVGVALGSVLVLAALSV